MLYLHNHRLQVSLLEPGEGYRKGRFDWSGIIQQVVLDGTHTFLSEENVSKTKKKTGGIGIIGSFEPAPGAMLRKKLYHVQPVAHGYQFTYDWCSRTGRKGIRHRKHISLEGTQILIRQELQNLGVTPISIGEYNHNFMIIDKHPAGPEYQVNFSFCPELTGKRAGQYNRIKLAETSLQFLEGFSNEKEDALIQLKGYDTALRPFTWELIYQPAGIGVREHNDFAIDKYQFWCKRHTICNEVFVSRILAPAGTAGDYFQWSRIYEFFSG